MGDTLKNGLKVAASIAGSPLAGTVVDGIFSLFGKKKDSDNSAKLQQQAFDFQREMNKLQMDFNSAEAQKTRDFNSNEASIQRDWEQAMYEQQRDDNQEWNNVGNQLKRAMAAGINPLSFEQGTMSLANPGTGASANGGAPASAHLNGAPSLMNPSNFGSIDLGLGDAMLKKAQIDNIEADTRRKLGDEDRAKDLHPLVMQQSSCNIDLTRATTNKEISQDENIKRQTERISSEIANIDENTNFVRLQQYLASLDGKQREIKLKHYEEELISAIQRNYSAIARDRSEVRWRLADEGKISSQILLNAAMHTNELSQVALNDSRKMLNDLDIKVQTSYGMSMAKLKYNTEKQKYDILVEDWEARKGAEKAEYDVRESSARNKKRITDNRQDDSTITKAIINETLDACEMVLGSAGAFLNKIKF